MDIYTIVRGLHNDKTSFIRLFGTVVNASFYYVLDNSTIYNNINSMSVLRILFYYMYM